MKLVKITFLFFILIIGSQTLKAQRKTNYKKLEEFKKTKKKKTIEKSKALEKYLKNKKLSKTIKTDSTLIVATRLNSFGYVEYLTTNNITAAKTSGTQKLHSGGGLGLSLDGTGIEIAEWDGGAIRGTHQEFTNTGSSRITIIDNVALNAHATHVAGTIIGSGTDVNAKGMAPNATLRSYDFSNDLLEMTNELNTNNLKLSNHSYSTLAGWYWDGSSWQWANAASSLLGHTEDFYFGFYDDASKDYDELCYLAPNYTIVKAASNDNGNGPTGGAFPKDGPYDILPTTSNAKNIIVVGAVNDIPNGYSHPSDVVIAPFSSVGPTDDGRIKPDIVANGVGLYSSYETSDTAYNSISGTSMATPTVTGSIALLNQHYKNLNGNDKNMTSATIKAILINTANEAGNNLGPDYVFGWGLMNTEAAVEKITEATTNSIAIKEELLANNQTFTLQAIATGTEPIKATVVWTDPAGTPVTDIFTVLDNPTKMLVNNIDFKITNADGTEYFPWKLDKDTPANAATNNTKNDTDNVEGISVGILPAGTVVTLTINHTGTLINNEQWFSLVTTGLTTNNNDNFANAYEFIPSEYSSQLAAFTTAAATADGGNYTCSMNTPKNNVWFKFKALSTNQSIFVLSDGAFGTLKNPILSLWDRTGATQLTCHQGTTANKAYLNVDNLTVGETYFIAVDNTNSAEAGTFSLFADASALQSETSTSGTLEPGTIRYNSLLHKFQGWNGTMWLNFN